MREITEGLWLWDGLEESETRRQTLHRHLAGLLGCSEGALRIVRDELGRPLIEKPSTPLQFSQARRDGIVAMAVEERGRAVGVDVEIPNPGPWVETVAGDFFGRFEQRWLKSLGEAARSDGFFRLWTGKEAVLKALGLGIAQGMAEPDFRDIIALGQPLQADEAEVKAFGRRFRLRWWFLQQGTDSLILCRAVEET